MPVHQYSNQRSLSFGKYYVASHPLNIWTDKGQTPPQLQWKHYHRSSLICFGFWPTAGYILFDYCVCHFVWSCGILIPWLIPSRSLLQLFWHFRVLCLFVDHLCSTAAYHLHDSHFGPWKCSDTFVFIAFRSSPLQCHGVPSPWFTLRTLKMFWHFRVQCFSLITFAVLRGVPSP